MIAVPAIWLLVATPRNPATGAVITVRLAGGGRQGYKQFGSVAWLAGLERPPAIVQTLGYGDDGFGDGAAVQALELDWGGSKARAVTLGSYYWSDAGFTLYSGPDGGADGDMDVVLTGRMAGVLPSPARLKLQMADPAVDLAKPAITATFAGSGGIEGDAELKGQVKWRAWGKCFNVTLRSLLKASNIHVATDPALPINAFTQVYDRGNPAAALTVVGWAGSIAATLAALIATAAPAGGAAVAASIGCIKWWYATPGKLTCDIEGENTGGYVDRPADIANRLVGLQGLAIDATMLTAARAARNDEAGWLIDDAGSSVASQLQELLSGVSLWWALSPVGTVEIGEWAWGASVASFKSERIERQAAYKPFSKAVLGWKPNHTAMARGDIAQAVLYADVAGTPTTLAAVNAGEGAKLTGIAAGATADIALVASANVTLTGNIAVRTGAPGWSEQVYSRDGYTGGAFASGVVAAGSNAMLGLNTDPTTDAGFAGIDYAIHASGDGNLYAYESGAATVINGAWAVGDVLAVTYDGIAVRYFQNGTIRRAIAAAAGLKFFFDSSLYTAGDSIGNLRFGPMSNNDFAAVGGVTKPANNADVTAAQPIVSRLNPASGQALDTFVLANGLNPQSIVASGSNRDGDAVSFATTLSGTPKIIFLPGGNAATAGQNIAIQAVGLSASGFTLKAKSQVVSAGTTHTDGSASAGSGVEPDKVINRTSGNHPYDNVFKFRFSVIVGLVGGVDPGLIEVGIFIKQSGSWNQVNSQTYNATGIYYLSGVVSSADFGAGNEFGIDLLYAEGAGTGLNVFYDVVYIDGTVTETSLTPTGASDIQWLAQL